jgi:electron transfer flavoprotein beta subunit
MKIAVALKRVADTQTRVQIEPGRAAIQERDVKFVLSPYDEIALEEALRIKAQVPGSSVEAVCVGPAEAQTVLRTALAMGADGAIHVLAPVRTGIELDGHQTASLLADALRARSFDLLLFGRLAVDDQSAQVGTIVAAKLGMPSVADAIRVEVEPTRVRVHHLIEGRVEVVECDLPAVLSAQKGLAEPHYPSVKDILAAKKKPIEVLERALPEPVLEAVSLELPPPRKPGRIVGKGPEAAAELVRLLREEARIL